MKNIYYAIALIVLVTLSACTDYENNADIENLENSYENKQNYGVQYNDSGKDEEPDPDDR